MNKNCLQSFKERAVQNLAYLGIRKKLLIAMFYKCQKLILKLATCVYVAFRESIQYILSFRVYDCGISLLFLKDMYEKDKNISITHILHQ